MDKLKSSSYRQRSYSNCGMQTNKQILKGQVQSQYNSLVQQQQQQQYPVTDSIRQQITQQDNTINTNLQKSTQGIDQNNSISVLQNYRIDCTTQKQNTSFQYNHQDSFQSSIPMSLPPNPTLQQSSWNGIQFCKNFVEFLKSEDSQKWIEVTENLCELSQMVENKLQHNQIYLKSQSILQFITFNAQFIPKKFEILMSCLTQEFQNLRDLYVEIQERQMQQERNNQGVQKEQENEQLYDKWYTIIQALTNQYYKIFSRHIQQYTPSNVLIPRKTLKTSNHHSGNYPRSSSKHSIHNSFNPTHNNNNNNNNNSLINNSNNIYINNTFNNEKENQQRRQNGGVSVEEYQQLKRERIIDKYSNENTLNLKIQQLEKQVKQLQSLLLAKVKDYDKLNNDKQSSSHQIQELINKVHHLEKNVPFSDPSRFSSLRSGESEYLIKRHEVEKNELKRIIEQKNQEIKSYRIELEGILGEIDMTSRNQTENTHRNQNN